MVVYKPTEGLSYIFCTCVLLVHAEVLLQLGVRFTLTVFFIQGSGWKVVASFEGNFPNRIKQLPLDRHFDLNNVKRVGVCFFPKTFCTRYVLTLNLRVFF